MWANLDFFFLNRRDTFSVIPKQTRRRRMRKTRSSFSAVCFPPSVCHGPRECGRSFHTAALNSPSQDLFKQGDHVIRCFLLGRATAVTGRTPLASWTTHSPLGGTYFGLVMDEDVSELRRKYVSVFFPPHLSFTLFSNTCQLDSLSLSRLPYEGAWLDASGLRRLVHRSPPPTPTPTADQPGVSSPYLRVSSPHLFSRLVFRLLI